MNIKIQTLLSIIILIFNSLNSLNSLKAEEIEDNAEISKDEAKEKIIIYYFNDHSEVNLYRYYSYIIPNSIYAEIEELNRYDVKTMPTLLDYVSSSAPEEVINNYIRLLTDRAKEFSANYIVTGSYIVKDGKITIKSQLFDVSMQNLTDVEECRKQIGAILLDIISSITEKINTELDKSYKKKKEEEEEKEKEKLATSPFLTLYNSLNGIVFGINYGMLNIQGGWGDIYESADCVSVYISYELTNLDFIGQNKIFNNMGISTNLDYFSTDTKDSNYYIEESYLSVWGITFNLIYLYRFSSYFNLAFSAGIGGSYSEIDLDNDDNDDTINLLNQLYDKETRDPYFNLSISTNIIFRNIQIDTGFSYKRLIYTDKNMNFRVIYLGIGYRI